MSSGIPRWAGGQGHAIPQRGPQYAETCGKKFFECFQNFRESYSAYLHYYHTLVILYYV